MRFRVLRFLPRFGKLELNYVLGTISRLGDLEKVRIDAHTDFNAPVTLTLTDTATPL